MDKALSQPEKTAPAYAGGRFHFSSFSARSKEATEPHPLARRTPAFLGRGESLFEGIDLPSLGYRVTEVVPTELATHLVLTR